MGMLEHRVSQGSENGSLGTSYETFCYFGFGGQHAQGGYL